MPLQTKLPLHQNKLQINSNSIQIKTKHIKFSVFNIIILEKTAGKQMVKLEEKLNNLFYSATVYLT